MQRGTFACRGSCEETDYASERFVETGLLSVNRATHTNMTYCFLATNACRVAEPALDDSEQIEAMRVPLAEVIERTNEGGPAGPPRQFPLLRAESTRAAADPMRRHVASPEAALPTLRCLSSLWS
jgi:hypothetical protein